MSRAHVANAHRSHHLFPDILLVWLPGDFFDHSAQNAVSEIRIGVLRTRVVLQRLPKHVSNDGFAARGSWRSYGFRRLFRNEHRIEGEIAVPSAGVLQ